MANEKQFKKWIKSKAPKGSLVAFIETMTGIGVPDMYTCFKGQNKWIEVKDLSTSTTMIKLRATQYMWLKNLFHSGGDGGLLIKHKDTIDFYDIYYMNEIDESDIKKSGKDYILTGLMDPSLSIKRNSSKADIDKYVYDLLIY